MKHGITIARWVFGLLYAVSGGQKIVQWLLHGLPTPTDTSQIEQAFLGIVVEPLIAVGSLAGGLLLLVRRTAPLGIIVLAPLVAGIFLFHLLISRTSWPWGALNLAWLLALAWLHRDAYAPLWQHGLQAGEAPPPPR